MLKISIPFIVLLLTGCFVPGQKHKPGPGPYTTEESSWIWVHDTPPEVILEQRIGDKVLPGISDARVVVLPTGERVLVMFGSEGRGLCCLLPPLPAGLKSAGPERMP
jgi:hypothetical protein